MKKFSLLVALALLITVGGVYATWIYSGSTFDTQTEPFVSKMGDIGHTGSSGAYSFSNNSLDFSVEPDGQDTKITTIVWGNGSITLTFTPEADITDAALAKALSATITVEQASSGTATYGEPPVPIYTLTPGFKVTHDASNWQTSGGEIAPGVYATYTHTITATDLAGSISIGNFHLPTEDEYNAFKTAIQDVKFRVRVTPGT